MPLLQGHRVLFVSTQMEAGGVQIRATSMMQALRAEGVEATVLFLYRKRGVFDGVAGVKCLLGHKPTSPADGFTIASRLLRFIRSYAPDAIVGMAHYSSPIGAVAGLLCGVPRRIGTQTNPPHSHNRLARVLDYICGVSGIYTSNVAASKTIGGFFSGYPRAYRKRLKVVHNGVKARSSAMTKLEARDVFGIAREAFVVVSCGRLSKQKNHSFLLEVIQEIPDAHLAILGDGELRGEVEAEISQRNLLARVKLLGEVHPDRVPDFLRCGDIFCFPSTYEAFGLALVEAMISGLPVVASNHPALVEVVENAGVLLPLDDASAWIDAIARLRLDQTERLRLGGLAEARAKHFSFDAMLNGFKSEMV